jgi:hypothetical protein
MPIGLRCMLVVMALLCGCARSTEHRSANTAGEPAAGSETAGGHGIVCEKEYVTGHRTRQRVCRRQSDIEREREADQAGIRNTRPEPIPPPSFGAGGM